MRCCGRNYGPGLKGKEGKTMKLLKYKRLMVILISLGLIFAFGVMTSVAQKTVKLKFKNYSFTSKVQEMKIDDTEGHVILINELKGVDVASGMVSHVKSFLDMVKGNGTVQGYTTNHYPDGSKMLSRMGWFGPPVSSTSSRGNCPVS
jgi:hypothetical protein